MKKDIHPKYYPNAKVKCSCGNAFEIGATVPELEIEICSACHPFYTGKEKIIDTAGRVDKFKKRVQKKAEITKGKKVISKKEKRQSKQKKTKSTK